MTKKRNIVFFTKYTASGPSSRYRSFSYFEYLENDFQIFSYPLFDDSLSNNGGIKISFKVFILFFNRIFKIIKSIYRSNLIVIEYELFPYFPPFFEYLFKLFGVKFVLDFDDAIFHNYDNNKNFIIRFLLGQKIARIASLANGVVTGSSYLSDYFIKYNKNVIQIPTSIKFRIYDSKFNRENLNEIVVGWLGSKTTSKNLFSLVSVIHKFSKHYSNVKFLFCGFDKFEEYRFFGLPVDFLEWSPTNEFKFLNMISIGIMPLDDNLFNKGKCGFKLIQYMAFGLPTLSTPTTSNVDINKGNNNLFANSNDEWFNELSFFVNNLDKMKLVGELNKQIVMDNYSVEVNYLKMKLFYNNILIN